MISTIRKAGSWLRMMGNQVLVCLAVWLAMSASSIPGKAIGIIFPISAFVSLGFEHSIANLYLIPAGMLLGAEGSTNALLGNLLPVTFGNLVGGALLTSGILALAHSQARSASPSADAAPAERAARSRRPALGVATMAAVFIVIVSLLWICREPIAGFVAHAGPTQEGRNVDGRLAALQQHAQHQDRRITSLSEIVRVLQSLAAAQAEEIVRLNERIVRHQTEPETFDNGGIQER